MEQTTSQEHSTHSAHNDSRKSKRKLMSVLAYLGVFIVIPFFMDRNDPVVKFHIKQGLILAIAEIVVRVLGMAMFGWLLWPFTQIINFIIFVLAVIGIMNALQGREKELPLVGYLAKNFTF